MTPPAPSPLESLVAQIRSVLFSAGKQIMSQAEPLIRQAAGLLAMEDRDAPAPILLKTELAFTVSAMIRQTKDKAFIRFGLETLLDLGRIGQILASSYIKTCPLPKEVLLAIPAGLSPVRRLLLVNRFFMNPHYSSPRLLQWGFETIKTIQGDDPEETLLFLEKLHDEGQSVSYPVQRELLRSRFGVWMRQLLNMDLDTEQIRFMARTSARLGVSSLALALARFMDAADPETVRDILDIFAKYGQKSNQTLIRAASASLKRPSPLVKLAAIKALKSLNAKQLVPAMTLVFKKHPDMRRGVNLFLLGLKSREATEFLRAEPPEERAKTALFLCKLMCAWDRPWVEKRISRLEKSGSPLDPELKADILSTPQADFSPFFRPPKPGPRPRVESEEKKASLLGRMKKALDAVQAPAQKPGGPTPKPRPEIRPGSEIHKQKIENFSYAQENLDQTVFTGSELAHIDFSDSNLGGSRFENCRMVGIDFSRADMSGAKFIRCRMHNCLFLGAVLDGLVVERSSLDCVRFQTAVLRKGVLTGSSFQECDFSGAVLDHTLLRSDRFTVADFSLCQLTSCLIEGIEFEDCVFTKAFARDTAVRDCSCLAASFDRCRFFHLDTDEPGFMRAEESSREREMEILAEEIRLAPIESGQAEGLMTMLMRRQLENDLKTRLRTMLESNQRRLEWASCMFPARGERLLEILPGLIEGEVGGEKKDRRASPPCKIHGYAPKLSSLELIEKYGEERKSPREEPIPIQGVFAVGDTGTIAQARSSELEFRVVYDPEDAHPKRVGLLKEKLASIEEWVKKTFDIRARLTLTRLDPDQSKKTRLHDGQERSITEAELFKEEFYRTAILLAGKKLLWWMLPPEVDDRDRSRLARLAQGLSQSSLNELIDPGPLEKTPLDRFLAASLWSLVKAMKNPFNSIMQFALLDKHLNERDQGAHVCERIKKNLFAGKKDLWDVDGCALMFREAFEHHQDRRDAKARDLMLMAFRRKTGLRLTSRPTGRAYEMRGYSFMEYFFPHSESEIAAHVSPEESETKPAIESFAELVELGERAARFLMDGFAAISALMRSPELETALSQKDLSMMGIKILTLLKAREHKVMRVPFMDPPGALFSGLEFSRPGMPGTPGEWVVKGESMQPGMKKPVMETLRTDPFLVRMACWLCANKIYSPGLRIAGTSLEYPVSQPDIAELLAGLHEFMSPDLVFDVDLSETLKPESVARAFILVNFTQPREERKIRGADLVYSTNRGELFCRKAEKGLTRMAESPLRFIAENTGLKPGPQIQIKFFHPAKSLCPRIQYEETSA